MFIDLFTRSGRIFKHKQLSLCLPHSYSVALNYRVRECVEAAGFDHIVRFPQSNPRHKPPSTSPSLTACNHQITCSSCCCCCTRLGSLCGKQLLVYALVFNKHIRLLFTLPQTILVQTLDRDRAPSQ